MFEFLLLDLDDTILDFKMQEKIAIRKTLSGAGIDPTDEVCALYSQINESHWKRLEKGEITRQQVLLGRFQTLFDRLGVAGDAMQTKIAYESNLSDGHYFLPGAEDALKSLSKKYRLFLVSNGTTHVQEKRLKSAGIGKYFEEIFISQNVGINKPAKGYFDYCFARIPGFDPAKAIIVGDSLSSDILGGKNAGIATCWVAPAEKSADPAIQPDYRIERLAELEALLERT